MNKPAKSDSKAVVKKYDRERRRRAEEQKKDSGETDLGLITKSIMHKR